MVPRHLPLSPFPSSTFLSLSPPSYSGTELPIPSAKMGFLFESGEDRNGGGGGGWIKKDQHGTERTKRRRDVNAVCAIPPPPLSLFFKPRGGRTRHQSRPGIHQSSRRKEKNRIRSRQRQSGGQKGFSICSFIPPPSLYWAKSSPRERGGKDKGR